MSVMHEVLREFGCVACGDGGSGAYCADCHTLDRMFESKRLADAHKLEVFGNVDRVSLGTADYQRAPDVDSRPILRATAIGIFLLPAAIIAAWYLTKLLIPILLEVSR